MKPHGIRLDRPVTIGTKDGSETWDTWAEQKTYDADREQDGGGGNIGYTGIRVVYTVRYDPRLTTRMTIRDRGEPDVRKAQVIRAVEHVGRRRYTVLTTYRGLKI